jgi:hypothetical protein
MHRAANSMPNKNPTGTSLVNGDDYIRRVGKKVAKRRLERAAKRSAATEEKIKPEDKTPLQKRT